MTRAGELRRDIATIRDHFRKPVERVTAKPGYDISGLQVPAEVLRALVVALAGGHTLYVRAPGHDFDSLLLRCGEMLPPLDDEEAEVLQVLEENGEYAEEQIAPRWFAPFHRLATMTQFGVEVPGNLRSRLFGPPGRPWVPGICSLSHRGVLHVPDLPRIDPETRRLLWKAWRETQVTMRGGFHYPADFILIADGAELPEEPFSLNLPWEGPEVKIGDVADDLRASIAEALAAQVRRKQLNGRAPLMSDNFWRDSSDEARLEIGPLLNDELTDAHVHRTIMVARTIADLAGSSQISGEHAAEAVRLTRGAREPPPQGPPRV
jgi:magnesium chelatase family protein